MSQRGFTRKRGTTWTAYWSVVDGEGERRQRSKGGFRTKGDAQRFLTDVLGKVQDGSYAEPRKMTVAAFLRDEWLPTLQQRASTVSSYRMTVDLWLVPHIGGVNLSDLQPKHVQQMLDALRAGGGHGGRKLSDRSVQYAYTVLRGALEHAARHGYVLRNAAAVVQRPAARRPEMSYWTPQEAAAFLDHVEDDRLYAAWSLFLQRGPRRGEVAGLRWSDVDLDNGRLSITHTLVMVSGRVQVSEPKTARGRRTIPLDAGLVSVLRAHRRRQIEDRLAWGEAWEDTGYVFTREDGRPLYPEHLTTAFEALVKESGLRRIRLHDTRHTAATLALQAGVPTEVVSRWLGHASVSTTQDLYQHNIPSMLEHAGEQLSEIIGQHRRNKAG